jgi:hypothetical protein
MTRAGTLPCNNPGGVTLRARTPSLLTMCDASRAESDDPANRALDAQASAQRSHFRNAASATRAAADGDNINEPPSQRIGLTGTSSGSLWPAAPNRFAGLRYLLGRFAVSSANRIGTARNAKPSPP